MFRAKLPDDLKHDKLLELQSLEILEYLPLCIVQAAAYIDQCDLSLSRYLEELKDSEILLEHLNEDYHPLRKRFDTPRSVLKSWRLSFEKIQKRYEQAGNLLSVMGFLDRQNIAYDLLQGTVETRHQLNQALGILSGFCLIVAEPSKDSFRMHRLVQLATRFWLSGKKSRYQALALKLITSRFLSLSTISTEQRRLIPHAKLVATYRLDSRDMKLTRSELQRCIAAYDLHTGHYDSAASYYQDAYDECLKLVGSTEKITLHCGGLLGVIRRYQGRFDDACAIQQSVLKSKESIYGLQDIDTIDTVSALADVFERNGRFDDAQALTERALDVRKRVLGDKDPKTLESFMHLALLYRRRTRYAEAKNLYLDSLTVMEETLGRANELTIDCVDAYSSLLREWGQYDESVKMCNRVVDDRMILYGEEHPKTLIARNNLALSYWRSKSLAKAEEILRDVCASHERCGRQDHIDALQACSNLSIILRDENKLEAAVIFARKAVTGRERRFGPDHRLTISSTAELALTLTNKDDFEEGEKLARRVIAIRKQRLGAEHTLTLNTLSTLGTIMQRTGRFNEASDIFQSVLAARINVLGVEHPSTKKSVKQLESLERTKLAKHHDG